MKILKIQYDFYSTDLKYLVSDSYEVHQLFQNQKVDLGANSLQNFSHVI